MSRRLLLARIIAGSIRSALDNCMRARLALSQPTIKGIADFFRGTYGKRDFQMPPDDIAEHFTTCKVRDVCVYLLDPGTSENAREFALDLIRQYEGINISSIVPLEVMDAWANLVGRRNVRTFKISRKGTISWGQSLKILRFLWSRSWDILLIPPPSSRVAGINGRNVAIMDFDKGVSLSIERMRLSDLLRIPLMALSFLTWAFISPPQTSIAWTPRNHPRPDSLVGT